MRMAGQLMYDIVLLNAAWAEGSKCHSKPGLMTALRICFADFGAEFVLESRVSDFQVLELFRVLQVLN